ncbi:hypothetical protein TrST_g9320 [Triparma strigata]|uniref:SAM domain-containing protein n=1 Tax=Triparma strigata TaxID=1606541 RepID=A0A9W7F3Q0_9STRA|nr:hypothetical protein TrST_g9320 [Triparma strigata]
MVTRSQLRRSHRPRLGDDQTLMPSWNSTSLNTLQNNDTLMSSSLFKATENLPAAVSDWSEEDVAHFLEDIGLHEYADAFVHERIRGITLAELTAQDVVELGIVRMGDRKFFFKALEHVLQVDEAHHSSHVHHVHNTPALQRHLERRSTLSEVEHPKLERRSNPNSFDALSRRRRGEGEGDPDDMMQPVSIVVRKKSGFTAIQQQRVVEQRQQELEQQQHEMQLEKKRMEMEQQKQLQQLQLKLLAQQQELERQKFQMQHQLLLQEEGKVEKEELVKKGGTKRRMSGPPAIQQVPMKGPPSIQNSLGSAENDSVNPTPKQKRRTVPDMIITTPDPESRELQPELLDTPREGYTGAYGDSQLIGIQPLTPLVQPQQQPQQQLIPILHNTDANPIPEHKKANETKVSFDALIANPDDIPKSAVGK